jgi:hypothetical protein
MSSFTTTYQFEKPDYKTLRYDIPLNANLDLIDIGLKCFPAATAPGTAGNQPAIVVTEGVLWRDSTNNILKQYSGTVWEKMHSDSIVCPMNAKTTPTAPSSGILNYYALSVGGIACPTWQLSNGKIITLQQLAHIAAINNLSLPTLIESYGTADGTFENVTDTTASDQSTAINDNFQESATAINNVTTVVTDLQSKVTTLISNLQTLGILASS